jgi:hypothetical protein
MNAALDAANLCSAQVVGQFSCICMLLVNLLSTAVLAALALPLYVNIDY